ncbi:hypothetical protein [Deinococcus sp. UYEF24]
MKIPALLLLLTLLGCTPPSKPAALDQPLTYSTHKEGHPDMPWTLDVYSPDGATLKANRTQVVPTGIFGGFDWRTTPQGGNIDLKFSVVAPQLGLAPRDIIKLGVDGQPQFTGVVVQTPGLRDPRNAEVAVAGAVQLLSRRVVDGTVYKNQDVGAIVRDLISRFRHPAITYDASLVPDTGHVLETFSVPYLSLDKALDTLSKSVPGVTLPFGTLGDGRFYFGGTPAISPPLAYSELNDMNWLQVSADDVVTEATVIGLTNASGAAPMFRRATVRPSAGGPPLDAPYINATLTGTVVDAEHAAYQAQVAAIPPAGADLLTYSHEPAGYTQHVVNEQLSRDSDPSTYAQNEIAPAGSNTYAMTLTYDVPAGPDGLVGYRLLYSTDHSDAAGSVQLAYNTADTGTGVNQVDSLAQWQLSGTGGRVQEVTAIMPPPTVVAKTGTPGTGLDQTYKGKLTVFLLPRDSTTPGDLRIYEISPIYLSGAKVRALAGSLIKLPARLPTELKLPRLLSPTAAVTVTGVPGGDLTADVAEYGFEHTEAATTTTTVKLEQSGASETARILRLVSQDRAGNAQTDLRAYLGQ